MLFETSKDILIKGRRVIFNFFDISILEIVRLRSYTCTGVHEGRFHQNLLIHVLPKSGGGGVKSKLKSAP